MFRTTRRLALTASVAAASAAALVPAGASAATSSFGSSLNHDPANGGQTCEELGAPSLKCTHVGSYYPGTSGKARAPKTGRVKAIKVRAQGPMTMTFRLAKVRNVSANKRHGQAKVVSAGRTVHVNGPTQEQAENGIYPVETFKANLRVHKGEEIAITTSQNTAAYCADGSPYQLVFSPILKLGQNFRNNTTTEDCQLLVKAIVKS